MAALPTMVASLAGPGTWKIWKECRDERAGRNPQKTVVSLLVFVCLLVPVALVFFESFALLGLGPNIWELNSRVYRGFGCFQNLPGGWWIWTAMRRSASLFRRTSVC